MFSYQFPNGALVGPPGLRLKDEVSTRTKQVFHFGEKLAHDLVPTVQMYPFRDTHAHDRIKVASAHLTAQH